MAWIESRQELGRHPKLYHFADILGISHVQAVGHLHYLWWWCLDYAPDGDLSRFPARAIARAGEWEGHPDDFIQALIESGFVDADLRIHDWHDYAGRLIEKRQIDADRLRRWRQQRGADDRRDAAKPDASVHVRNAYETRTKRVTNAVTVPNLTVPNLTGPEDPHVSGGDFGETEKIQSAHARRPLAAVHKRARTAAYASGEETPPSGPVAAPEIAPPPAEAYQAKLRDELGCSPQTRREYGAWGTAIRELRTATPPVLPDELPTLIARYYQRWPGITCTPMALAKHLGLLRGPPRAPPPNGKRTVDRSDLAGDLDEYVELARRKAEGGDRATE